ncbi:MAG: peptide deformylase [Anaerolineales bacterium]|nr:peptide deformylase [Anaerolineales bacterium]
MVIREIITNPNPVLRRKSRPVTEYGEDLQRLIDDMVETMRQEPGIGLAAPQVSVSQRVIVVEYGDENDDVDEPAPPKLYVVINPEITRFSEEREISTEGCLSVPGLLGDVERSLEVTVKGKSRRGQLVKIKAKGWLARIFQHEVNHLDGFLFIDKAIKVWEMSDDAPGPAMS